MNISEPTTMATDYALATLVFLWGARLLRVGSGERQRSVQLWAAGFLVTGLASITGGTYHGLTYYLDGSLRTLLWKTTIYSIGLAGVLMLSATFLACLEGRWRAVLLAVAATKFVLYAIWMINHNEFKFVIYDYAASMIAIGALHFWGLARMGERGGGWVISGVLLSFGGAALQRSGVSLHAHFNHNDLFHVVQMASFYLFYRGGRLLRDQSV